MLARTFSDRIFLLVVCDTHTVFRFSRGVVKEERESVISKVS
jgi:hypothetical protein